MHSNPRIQKWLATAVAVGLACLTPACNDGSDCLEDASCESGGKADDLGGPPEIDGRWSEPKKAAVNFLHGVLSHTGEVMLFSTRFSDNEGNIGTYDPVNDTFRKAPQPADFDCSHHAQLADGSVLVMGGGGLFPGDALTSSFVYDPVTRTFSEPMAMATPRWYPTALPLADGRVIAVSGEVASSATEIYDPTDRSWSLLPGADREFPPLYPALHQLPSGDVLASTVGFDPGLQGTNLSSSLLRFDENGGARWTDVPSPSITSRTEGTSLIWVDDSGETPRASIMVLGGGLGQDDEKAPNANPASAEIGDVSDAENISWRRTPDMAHERTNLSVVVLPTGDALVIGGRTGSKFVPEDSEQVFVSEIYNRETDSWSEVARSNLAHHYHTVALLLPDGRVFAGGGVGLESSFNRDDFEIFSPPYLFAGARPTIQQAPKSVEYGSSFEISVSSEREISRVVMISPSSVTHHTDAGGRYVELRVESSEDGTVTVRAPTGQTIMPAGHHMLFALDSGNVPSPAVFLAVGNQSGD